MKTITSAFGLTFHSNNQDPGKAYEDRDFLLFNPCDGYHVAIADFEGSEFIEFRQFAGSSYGKDFYTAWAVLPDTSDVRRDFPHQDEGLGENTEDGVIRRVE
ncbi:hypothetical protein ABWH88_06740 [Marinobacter adhaerens]|jgi:hypothetical protein|uniref:hypothetical protein n=1 Tax=Marinobacter adhaerens TaxID=1033846 RepID=UPI001C5FD8A8|nr:hypothetical protein [Marinobacter adhaerens]MBW4979569.1 hypothetical protein [Marinobacter adhaerens]